MSIVLWIVLIIVLLIGLLLVSVLRVEARFDEAGGVLGGGWLGFAFRYETGTRKLSASFLGLPLFRKTAKREEKRARKPEEKRRKRRKRKRTRGISRGRVVAWGATIKRALVHFLRRLRMDQLELDATIATPDPALTGMLYGWTTSIIEPLRPRLKRASMVVSPDFEAEVPILRADVAVGIRLVHLLTTGWIVASAFLKEKLKGRFGRKPPRGGGHGSTGVAQIIVR